RIVNCVVLAAVGLQPTLPEQADHLYSFLQPRLTVGYRRPSITEDVLVQVLAAADAERKPAGQERCRRRGRLGDARRMGPSGGAGDGCDDLQTIRPLRDGAEHAPHEGAMALAIDPGVVVVGDAGEAEARRLGSLGVIDERRRAVLLASERV